MKIPFAKTFAKLTDAVDVLDSRALLRDRAKLIRSQSKQARPDAPVHAAANFMRRFEDDLSGKIVAVYLPIKDEMDTWALIDALWAKSIPLCAPMIEKRNAPLIFLPFTSGTPLVKGAYNIQEPSLPDIATAPSDQSILPDYVLVPLLAYDWRLHRLGYGGGYYDRSLAQLRQLNPNLRAIGYAYADQEIDDTKPQSHDQPLDAIITERSF